MQLRNLYEYSSAKPKGIDRDAHVISGVKILGAESKNGYQYTDRALNDAVGLYEGLDVFVDHDRSNPKSRKVGDRFGVLKGIYREEEAVYGDLHFLEHHPQANLILENVERMPDGFGLSHVAYGQESRNGNKRPRIESLKTAYSADVVVGPATNKSLFEQREDTVMAKAKLIFEEGGVATLDPPDVDVEIAPDASQDDKLRAAFKATTSYLADKEDFDVVRTMDGLNAIFKKKPETKKKETKKEDEKMEQADPPVHPDLAPLFEQLGDQIDALTKKDQLRSALEGRGLSLPDIDVSNRALLEQQEGEEAMVKLIDSWPAHVRMPRRSLPRSAGPRFESHQAGDKLPDTAAAFAASLR